MVAPEQYLATCGWVLTLVTNDGGTQHELRRDEDADFRLQQLRKTTPPLNGFDLLLRCLANGYEVHNGQQILCSMMECQEHLMTKSFLIGDTTTAPEESPLSDEMNRGDFFTWQVDNTVPAQSMGMGSSTGRQKGGHMMQFDDLRGLPAEAHLGEPSDIDYHIHMPISVYRYGSQSGAGMDLHLNVISEQCGNGENMNTVHEHPEHHAGGEHPFEVHGHFADDYMNAGLGE